MNNNQIDLSFGFQKIAFMPSLRCDANCRHCLFIKDQRQAGAIERSFIKSFLKSLPEDISLVSITGGEPFFNLDDLFYLSEQIASRDLEFSIVTNGLWTRKTKNKDGVLKKLRQDGLSALTVSYDEYHKPRLSESELFELLFLSAEKGIRIGVKSCGSRMKSFTRRIKRKFHARGVPIEVEWFSLDRTGMAAKLDSDKVRKRIHNCCTLLAHPLVLPDGTLYACCSTEILNFRNDWLKRGNARIGELRDILEEANRDFRLIALSALGPSGLAKIVGVKPEHEETTCELCTRILNNTRYRKEIEKRLVGDRRLRQEVVARFMLLSYKECEKEKKNREKWQKYFRSIGVEK